MNLNDLEKSLRPQFVWDREEGADYWHTDRHQENIGGGELGMTVFVGLATLHNFRRELICAKLKITCSKYDQLWLRFHKYILEGLSAEYSSLMEVEKEIGKKVLTKSRLVQSALMLDHAAGKINFTDLTA